VAHRDAANRLVWLPDANVEGVWYSVDKTQPNYSTLFKVWFTLVSAWNHFQADELTPDFYAAEVCRAGRPANTHFVLNTPADDWQATTAEYYFM
jgi:hypothetical protein